MSSQVIFVLVPFLSIFLTIAVLALANRKHQRGGPEEEWLRAGWTVVRQDVNRLFGSASSVSTRVRRGLALEIVSETPPSSAAPFHEVMLGRFSTRWRTYLRVDLRAERLCPFQLFERAALVKAPTFSLSSVGAVWVPRWRERVLVGDPRLDSRFDLHAEDPARAISLVAALATPLLAAPCFGLLEVVGSELRVYLSTRAAGLGELGAGLAAHVDALNDMVVDVASALENA